MWRIWRRRLRPALSNKSLRRRAAPALLIQKPDFRTIKCPSICSCVCVCVCVCVSGESGKNTQWYLRRPDRPLPLGLFVSRFSRCRRKVRLRGKGMICRDPKKVDFFQFLDHSNSLDCAVQYRSQVHSSRPRTQLS